MTGEKNIHSPDSHPVVILTGAGVSAESGLGTFRDKDGLWTKYDLEEVATPQGFARNPKLVWDFYNARRLNLLEAAPNAAHHALARLQRERPGYALIVTQNVDNLHEQAGSTDIIHMHGNLLKQHCEACGGGADFLEDIGPDTVCGHCGAVGRQRPSVVWFGEMPLHMERIYDAILGAELFVSIGTSGQVYPAAGFVSEAKRVGAQTLELNLEATDVFDQQRVGPATEVVPAWVDGVLAQG